MKRNFFIRNPLAAKCFQGLIVFLIAISILVVGLLILTFVEKQYRLSESVLKIIMTVLLSLAACLAAYIFRKFSNLRGYICGLISTGVFGGVKLIMSLSSVGIGKGNILIYVCIAASALLGGIVAANNKKENYRNFG